MRLKTIVLSGAFALLSASFVAAQSQSQTQNYGNTQTKNYGNVSIGGRLGLTIPSFNGGGSYPLSQGFSSTERFGAAVFADFKISKMFSIQPMLEFAQEGAKRNGMQALVNTSEPSFAANDPYGAASQAASVAASQGLLAQYPALSAVPLPAGENIINVNAPAPDYLYADANSTTKMNYLMLPVLAKFGWNFTHNSPWRIYFDVGPYIALLVSAHNTVKMNGNGGVYSDANGGALVQPQVSLSPTLTSMLPSSMLSAVTTGLSQMQSQLQTSMSSEMSDEMTQYLSGTQNIKDQLHKLNWGLEGNVGIQYQINRHKIFIEGGGNYGLMVIQKSTGKDANGKSEYLNGKNHIGAGTVMIGYAYTL